MKYNFIKLAWDTEYFGIHSAKVVLNEKISTIDFDNILNRASNYDFITLSNLHNNTENNQLIGLLSKAFLVDINVQFEMNVKTSEGKNYYPSQNYYLVNDQVIQIASNSFNHSRFFNDPYLNKNQSKDIYLNWVKSSFDRSDKFFIIAEEEKEILGFILFSIDGNGALVIELIALDKSSQGKGIGTKLIQSLVAYSMDNDILKIKVGTQIDNIQAMNFYAKKGFSFSSKSSIYHYWPRKETLND